MVLPDRYMVRWAAAGEFLVIILRAFGFNMEKSGPSCKWSLADLHEGIASSPGYLQQIFRWALSRFLVNNH